MSGVEGVGIGRQDSTERHSPDIVSGEEGPSPEAPGPGATLPGPADQSVPPAPEGPEEGWGQPPLQGGLPSPGGWGPPWSWEPPPEASGPSGGPPHHQGRTLLAATLAGLVLLSSGIGIGWALTRGNTSSSTTVQAPLTPVPQASPSTGQANGELSVQAIADKVDPGVVDIRTVIDGFGNSSGGGARAAGTGMVLTSSGEVLTNNHVIAGATSISVTVQGRGGSYSATVIGADPTDDVALLQVQGVSGLPTVTLADSSTLQVGQEVVAIGNALGQGGSPTVTQGTVSALHRSITVDDGGGSAEHLTNLIETDAKISPGDSGGPLVNGAGQVVGMITAAQTAGPDRRVSIVGFAIPVNTAVNVVNEIRAGHASSKIILGHAGFLGVEVRNLDATAAAQLGLGDTSGALVVGVVPGTPAARAGISSGAVITAIDGRKTASVDALGPSIHPHKPGEQINVTWVDQSGTHTATVTLIGGPAV